MVVIKHAELNWVIDPDRFFRWVDVLSENDNISGLKKTVPAGCILSQDNILLSYY